MAMLVQGVVGEFELEEGDGLLHPVAARGWGVWVQVGPAGGLRLGFPSHLPLILVPLEERTEAQVRLWTGIRVGT